MEGGEGKGNSRGEKSAGVVSEQVLEVAWGIMFSPGVEIVQLVSCASPGSSVRIMVDRMAQSPLPAPTRHSFTMHRESLLLLRTP